MWAQGIRFELLEKLGEGGQGRVFKALRVDSATGLSQTVAIKILHSETAVELWKKEFESLSRVRSPYCVHVLSFERIGGRPALVLELVEGASLMDLGRTCLLGEAEIDEITAQTQAALLELLAHGIFHGDLSPHNVMVDENGRVRLLDFGLANGGERLTPEFAAPERLNGARADYFSDLYSLGCIRRFLRGEAAGSAANSPLLHPHPHQRAALNLRPNVDRQAALALAVRAWRDRRALAAGVHTRTQQKSPERARKLSPALALFFFSWLLSASGASHRAPTSAAFLSLRTRSWHHFIIDGRPAGYAPVTVQLMPGQEHVLEWTSAHGNGRRRLHLKRDQHLVLSDRDFSH